MVATAPGDRRLRHQWGDRLCGYRLPDFYSGATGQPGHFTEGFSLRRLPAAALQHRSPALIARIPTVSTGGLHHRAPAFAIWASYIGRASAGENASSKLTFQLDHLMGAGQRPAPRSAATSVSTTPVDRIRALDGRRPIRPTSTGYRRSRQPEPGRGSTYPPEIPVQTNGASSLALCGVSYWDGFAGGAVAYRSYRFGGADPVQGCDAHVIKLHGSIDWHVDDNGDVWRVRDGDAYPVASKRVLIYPQASKYVATQRDPFAAQFDLFRRQLSSGKGHVLVTCGYSFGDEHINDEIYASMSRRDNDTAMIALCFEGQALPKCLETWRNGTWGKQVYILTEKGIHIGADGPLLEPGATPRNWWTFKELSNVLKNGLREQL